MDIIEHYCQNASRKSLHENDLGRSYLAKGSVPTLEHPPYSPDLALAYFVLFPRLKTSLKEDQFADAEIVKHKTKKYFLKISQNEF